MIHPMTTFFEKPGDYIATGNKGMKICWLIPAQMIEEYIINP